MDLYALVVQIVVGTIILAPVLWLAGKALVGGEKAKFLDAVWIILLGTIIGAVVGSFVGGLVSAILMFIIWLALIKHFFDCGWLMALAIAIIAVILFVIIGVVLGLLLGFAFVLLPGVLP
jgi:hypothetical protein